MSLPRKQAVSANRLKESAENTDFFPFVFSPVGGSQDHHPIIFCVEENAPLKI
jgi:hypothetical protein